MENRLKKLRELMNKDNLDGFILFNKEYSNRPNTQYLSGFTGSYSILLITMNDGYIITDSRYFKQAEKESDFNLIKQLERNPWTTIRLLIKDLKISRLGFEADLLTVEKYLLLDKLNLELKGYERLIINFRTVKDQKELGYIKTACQIASQAFENFLPKIKAGMKESELAAELVYEMRKLGAEKPVKGHFVVASGKRGQMPHGVFTDKIVEDGDFITFDFGAVYHGYVSDITRTVGIGDVSKELIDIYEIVLKGQKKTIDQASSHHTGKSLDQIAREYITKKGYGEYFTHSTGHGIGLEIHELPMVNNTNNEKLPVNSVVTIEPGIYIPDLGGVRIEDNIIILEKGCEVITSAQKELVIL